MKQAHVSIDESDITSLMRTLGAQSRASYGALSQARNEAKDMALVSAAMALREHVKDILAANATDMEYGSSQGLSDAALDRLALNEARVEAMASGLETVATVPDPVNKIMEEWERPNGLVIQRVSIPLGVIGLIYEARPNVTADAAALSIKSGNAVILRCGSECLHSAQAIVECIRIGLRDARLPEHAVQLVPTRDRAAVAEMLSMTGVIDVIVPRGGKSLCERVMNESKVPTLLHLEGNCHTYVHEAADVHMAREVLLNAKLRRTGICGATESLLVDEAIASKVLPDLAHALMHAGCEVRGDALAKRICPQLVQASDEDWAKEYLAPVISVKVVQGLDAAIEHVNTYGSHHTDAIITEDTQAARTFLRGVDSAIVMHNTSTQFADGGEFGFGSEIGIATGRLHARGPVGAEQLTTYKYVVHGSGQVRP